MDVFNKLEILLILTILQFIECSGSPCSKDALIGSNKPQQLSDRVDSKTGQLTIMRHADYTVRCCGAISQWSAYIMEPGTIRFQVWRGLGTGEYTLIGENLATYHSKEENLLITIPVHEVQQIAVKEGDLIGWYSQDEPMVSYNKDNKASGVLITGVKDTPVVGATLDLVNVQVSDPRSYALSAKVSKGLKPKFKNLGGTISIVSDLGTGTQIYQLGFDGVDGVEVPKSFSVFLDDFSQFFAYNESGNSVYIKHTPPKEKYTLNFSVKDHCGNKDTGSLKIEVETKLPAILNLPSAVSVREDAHNQELMLLAIEVVHTGPVACSLKDVEPSTGRKDFLVRNVNGSAPEVILKATARLSYAKEDAYELTIKCAAGKESDTNSLIVNVEPNKAPVFTNLPNTVSVHAEESIIGGLIFHMTYDDEEDNPVFYNISCDPHPCPFDVTQGGSIMVTDDLRTAISNVFYIEISIGDHFNVAGPGILVVNITGLNRPPLIYNLPKQATVSLPENSPPGMPIFKVEAVDQDVNDNLTFSLRAKPTNMIPLFSIDELTGLIHALVPFDFESLKSKNIKLYPTVFDGQDKYEGVLKLSVIDINEPPVFQYHNYTVFTSENAPGKTIVKNRIKAIDNDKGDVITYGLHCGEETDLFNINEHTADIEQSYELDVDRLGVSEHTIYCTVTATDTVGQKANALVRFIIYDADDNDPDFQKTSYLFVATRDLPIYSVIGYSFATDLDTSSVNSKLFYYIEEETDDFVTDNNGTIHLTKDLSEVEIGTLFKFTMKVEDGNGKKDSAPVTVVVLGGEYKTVVSSLVAMPLSFFDIPENVVWFITSIYLLIILFSLLAYLCQRYVKCLIDIQPRMLPDMTEDGIVKLKGIVFNNLLSNNSSRRSSIVSITPIGYTQPLQDAIVYGDHLKLPLSRSPAYKPATRRRSTIISPMFKNTVKEFKHPVVPNVTDESELSTQPETKSNEPGRKDSVISKMSTVDLPSALSRVSLSDIQAAANGREATPWKPWAISDFKTYFNGSDQGGDRKPSLDF